MYVYTHIPSRSENVYELPLLPNNTPSVQFLHESGAVRSVDWIFIIGCRPGADIGQKVLQSSFRQEVAAYPVTYGFFSLSHSSKRHLLFILCINYVIIMCINDNKAVINNNYGRLQDLILLFRLSTGAQEDFIEICGHFWHAPYSKEGSPVLF